MSLSQRQRALLAQPRWSWLGGFVGTWYADPLAAADGCGPDELAAAARRLGRPLPAELAEWFELVGHRLEDVQDSPARPDRILLDDDGICVWVENQGVWAIVADPDGVCRSSEVEHFATEPVSVSEAVRGMVLSDTLVGAWPGLGRGPLGRLAGSVRGDAVEDVSADTLVAVRAAYPRLPVAPNPYFAAVPLHGDEGTVLRGDLETGLGLMWMTATEAARERLELLVPLGRPSTP